MKRAKRVTVVLLIVSLLSFPCMAGELHPGRYGTGIVYENDDGTICENEWKLIDDDWYYFGYNGDMYKNSWKGAYYLGSDGKMLKDTVTPSGYRVDDNGAWDGALYMYSPSVQISINNSIPQKHDSTYLLEHLKNNEVIYYKRVDNNDNTHYKFTLSIKSLDDISLKHELFKNQWEVFEGGRITGHYYSIEQYATAFDEVNDNIYIGNGEIEYVITLFDDGVYVKQIKGSNYRDVNGLYILQKSPYDHFKQ